MHINGPKSSSQQTGTESGVIGMKIQHLDRDATNMTRILTAIQHGLDNAQQIKDLIAEGNDINRQDRYKATALHIAAEKGYTNSIEVLTNNGANLDVVDMYGYTPLIRACRTKQIKAFQQLVNAGADLTIQNDNKMTVLHFASQSDNTSCLDIVLAHKDKRKVLDMPDQDGNTPLILSLTVIGQNKAALRLIENGAALEIKETHYGMQAIHYAANNKSPLIVEALLDGGVDINVEDKSGNTPFVLALKGNNAEIVKILIDRGCDTLSIDGLNATALSLSTLLNHIECVKILLNNYEDPDELGYFGQTSLMGASYQSNIAMLNVLLQANADPNVVSRQGTTALVNAIIKVTDVNVHQRHDIVKRMVRAGANVNYRVKGAAYFTECTNGRNCALSFAIASGYVSLVNIIITAGAEVSPCEIDQWKNTTSKEVYVHFYKSNMFLEPLRQAYCNTRSLKHICRAEIRASLGEGTEVEQAIPKLNVPRLIRDYLNYSDIENLCYDKSACITIGDDPGIYQPTPTVMACGLHAIEREFGFHKFSS